MKLAGAKLIKADMIEGTTDEVVEKLERAGYVREDIYLHGPYRGPENFAFLSLHRYRNGVEQWWVYYYA